MEKGMLVLAKFKSGDGMFEKLFFVKAIDEDEQKNKKIKINN